MPAEARSAKVGGRLDLAIDRAVREMLDVEQAPGLRARVLHRIDRPVASGCSRKDRFSRTLVLSAIPLAAAAILILALRVILAPEPMQPAATQAPRVAAAPNVAPVEQPHMPRPQPARTARRPVTERIVAAAVAADDTEFAVPALAGPESLTVRPLAQPAAQQLPPTGPEPMHIRALEISALPETPRERREE